MSADGRTTQSLLLGDRPLPRRKESERCVLGCLLQWPGEVGDLVFSKLPVPDCFWEPAHKEIYAAMLGMREEGHAAAICPPTLIDRLADDGPTKSLGGSDLLVDIADSVISSAQIEMFVGDVQGAWGLRRCADIGVRLVDQCLVDEQPPGPIIADACLDLDALAQSQVPEKAQPIGSLVHQAFEYLVKLNNQDPEVMGLPTGFVDLDRIITGLQPSSMVVLAARPSIGKTTLALNMGVNIARRGTGVGVFSLEMSAQSLALRLLCSEARINAKKVRDGALTNAGFRNDLTAAGDRLMKMPIFIDDSSRVSPLELRQKARRMHKERGVGLFIIDYLQLMRPDRTGGQINREQEVANMSSEIKALAKDLHVPIILIAQLNRQAELGGRPKLAHLRESGAIEQDADVVLLLHRERIIENAQSREEADRNGQECEVIVAKNRNGDTDNAELLFFRQWTLFTNKSRVSDEDANAAM